MDMSKQKERHGGRLFCRCEKYKKGVQTSRRLWRLQKVVSRRVCPCAFQRGSLTLETSIVLPFLLCAVTAMLYVFVMTGFQAEKYRTLTQQAQLLAVTVVVRDWVGYTGESFSGDGEIFVYVTPKGEVYHRSRDCRYLNVSIQSIAAGQLDAARNWDGSRYTACVYCVKKEKPGAMVYITNYGTNYHNRKTCRGLKRTVMAIPYSQTGGMRCCQGCGGS